MYACTDYDLLIMYKCVKFCEINIHSFIKDLKQLWQIYQISTSIVAKCQNLIQHMIGDVKFPAGSKGFKSPDIAGKLGWKYKGFILKYWMSNGRMAFTGLDIKTCPHARGTYILSQGTYISVYVSDRACEPNA